MSCGRDQSLNRVVLPPSGDCAVCVVCGVGSHPGRIFATACSGINFTRRGGRFRTKGSCRILLHVCNPRSVVLRISKTKLA